MDYGLLQIRHTCKTAGYFRHVLIKLIGFCTPLFQPYILKNTKKNLPLGETICFMGLHIFFEPSGRKEAERTQIKGVHIISPHLWK